MERSSKRWLMSMMKTSGSKRKYIQNGNAADERHAKGKLCFDDLPKHESVKSTFKFYNGKINYGILVRFLRGQVGKDWDIIYSEIISRIPIKLLDYKEMIFWFVANEVEIIDDKLWDKKKQRFIWTGNLNPQVTSRNQWLSHVFYEFYVDPTTNLLQHIQQKFYKN